MRERGANSRHGFCVALGPLQETTVAPENRLMRIAWRDVLDGKFDADGQIPCQIDGGLKCFGHPIGATGIRMVYENYLQLLGRAGSRQRRQPVVNALAHNLGGAPFHGICSISIVGLLR